MALSIRLILFYLLNYRSHLCWLYNKQLSLEGTERSQDTRSHFMEKGVFISWSSSLWKKNFSSGKRGGYKQMVFAK